jgi:cell division protein FtsL
MYIISGSILTEDFFVKNTLFIGVMLVLMVLYISNRYSCIEQISKIESLQKELKDAKYEYQTISSELTGISRQSHVQKLIEENQLGLQISNKPTYEIHKDDDKKGE